MVVVISEYSLIHYKYIDDNTNEAIFLEFISEVGNKLKNFQIKDF